jgi:GNAT superfamily N-acetyltransferase
MTKEQESTEYSVYGKGHDNFMRALKEVAERQIASRSLRGYLAYVDGLAIGWCNANDKANFPPVSGNGARFYSPAEKREKVVACFEIAPEFREKGVATTLLQRVVDDAKNEGYIAVEGYPRTRAERYEWDFTGPVRLYEKVGFTAIKNQDGKMIMRRDL